MPDLIFELETLDELPDTDKALYTETDGKYRLNLDAYAERVKAPVAAKNKELLGKLAKNKELAAQLDKFKDLDDEKLEAFRKWEEEQAQGGTGKPAENDLAAKYEAEIKKREAKLKDLHSKELAEREKRIQEAEAKLNSYVLDTALATWADKYKADPDAKAAVLKLGRDNYRLDEKGQVIAVDEDGDPLPEKAEEHFANKFRAAHKYLFLSDETGGSGPNGNGKASRPKAFTLTREQARDPNTYRRAKEAADKAGQELTITN